jgi:hypothetical protein
MVPSRSGIAHIESSVGTQTLLPDIVWFVRRLTLSRTNSAVYLISSIRRHVAKKSVSRQHKTRKKRPWHTQFNINNSQQIRLSSKHNHFIADIWRHVSTCLQMSCRFVFLCRGHDGRHRHINHVSKRRFGTTQHKTTFPAKSRRVDAVSRWS